MVFQNEIRFSTSGHRDMHDLTDEVGEFVNQSGISTGTCHVFNVGSTGSISTIEYEAGLQRDMPKVLDRLIPPSTDYGHELAWHDGNGHSHLQATWLGPDLTVPIVSGQLALGTWQQIFHIECDIKPRDRIVIVTINGD